VVDVTLKLPITQEQHNPYRKVVVIIGVPVDVLSMDQALDRVEEFVAIGRRTGRTHQVSTVNTDFIVNAVRDPETRFILQETDLAIPDGMPIVWGAKFLGVPMKDRVAGADMIPLLAERASERGYSMFFLGAGPGIAAEAAHILQSQNPGLRVAGVYSPSFTSILEMEHEVIQQIKETKPDILLVAFGNPKQEKWIAMHRYQLGVPVLIGIGGTLDFITGNTIRAPKWMQKNGLEWLHRLVKDPARLWRRYVLDTFVFGTFILRQWWQVRKGGKHVAAITEEETLVINNIGVLRTNRKLTVTNLKEFNQKISQLAAQTSTIVLDMANTEFVDSAAVGSLVHHAKEVQISGGEFYLSSVSRNVQKTLELLFLDSYFIIMNSVEEIFADLEKSAQVPLLMTASVIEEAPRLESRNVIQIPRRFDAITAAQVEQDCDLLLEDSSNLVLDFSNTVFLASAGLVVLSTVNNKIQASGGELILKGVNKDVLRVIALMKFDQKLKIFPAQQR
jgi:N-acetylglucosaminyldiphosphoundecaprenol N-acetyl-beta-D-mannosaminyltransferase